MPPGERERPVGGKADTKLARLRRAAGHHQNDMARLTGLAPKTYERLETNAYPHHVNLRALVNCAQVLKVDVTELFEDEWLEWHTFDQRVPGPPP